MAGDPIDADGLRSLFPIVLRRAGHASIPSAS
jgi:hypothetical protein